MMETLHLLASPANAAHLKKSLKQKGRVMTLSEVKKRVRFE